jgi:FKBP-type peptidyl-prolyl cis-trans isomerase SlpA
MTNTPSKNTAAIQPDSQVCLYFNLALADGTLVDGTEEGEPMTFTLGDGTMIEGLELALLGLKAGDKQSLSIPPETGFGFSDPQAIQWMPLTDFSDSLKPQAGQIMNFTLPNGQDVPGAILELEKKRVKVDFNHPLADLEVVFAVEIIEVINT